jgi:Peptidase MA superfamily
MITGFGFRSQAPALVAALLFASPAIPEGRMIQRGRLVLIAPETFTTQDEKALVQGMTAGMKTVEDFLGKRRERVVIRAYARTGDFTVANRMPWWVGGVLMGNEIRIQPVRVLNNKGILASTLTHEYAHLVMRETTGERGPRWLQEGTAVFLAGEFAGKPKRKQPWAALEKDLEHPFKDKDTSFEAYRQARWAVEYLVQTYGRENYLNLLENIRLGKDMDAAMKEAIRKTPGEVEADYLERP